MTPIEIRNRSILTLASILTATILQAGSAKATTPPPVATVEMKSLTFAPKTLEITSGQSVVFKNTARTKHSAESDGEGAKFDTGLIPPNASSKPILFNKAGRYAYHCGIHGRTMSGVIVVKDSGQ